jgi:hypothetical protein
VKCDETNPSCSACTSTGRKCDGYEQSIDTPSDLSNVITSGLGWSPSVEFIGTEKECHSFQFFRQKTAAQLSGFFGGDFWETLLLQAALHEPSIRHAVLALGSLHRNFEQNNGLIMSSHTDGWSDDFTLKNYSQAIKTLIEPLSQTGKRAIDVYLICSILFAFLEVSRSYIQN